MDQFSSPGSGYDYLGPATPVLPDPARGRGRGKRAVLVGAAALLAVGVAGGAYAAAAFLSGGGTQPEQVLPAGAVVFAKLDLDPAANQKVAVYQLSHKFPELTSEGDQDGKSPIGDLFAEAFDDAGLDYGREIKPWLGDRAALALYAAPSRGEEPQPALAIAYTDEDRMTAAMTKFAASNDNLGWATSDGFVVISDSTAHAEALAERGQRSSLADQDEFRADTASLDGDQLAIAWADLGAGRELAAAASGVGDTAGLLAPAGQIAGRVVFGLHAASNYLEIQGRSHGLKTEGTESGPLSGAASRPGTGLAGEMSADSLVAASATGLDQVLAHAWNQFGAMGTLGSGPADFAEQFGLRLPSDFPRLLGSETALALSGPDTAELHFTVRSREGDAARAQEVARNLSPRLGRKISVVKTQDGFAAGDIPANVAAAAGGSHPLSASDAYRLAVPDADRAGLVVYANIGALLDGEDSPEAEKFQALSAAGLTVIGGTDPVLRLRITVR